MISIIKKKNLIPFLLLIGILTLGAFFRFYNLNWDNNSHLHPDERFLTMVGNAMRLPSSFVGYLNPHTSTFNPANIGYNFFVYGLFPVTLNKILAIILNTDSYNLFTIQGRFLSGIADMFVIIFIYKAVYLLEKKYKLNPSIKLLASFLYTICILPIQLSHFFTVDTFLNMASFASFYFALSYWVNKKKRYIFLSGLLFGFAISSKISAVYIFPLVAFLFLQISKIDKKNILLSIRNLIFFSLTALVAVKFLNPYIFTSGSLIDFRINKQFIDNIQSLSAMSSRASTIPPNIQWLNKNQIYPLINLIIFGTGIPLFIIFLVGIFNALKTSAKSIFTIMLIWMFTFFTYQSVQAITTMRYYILIYPFIAIFSGIGFSFIYKRFGKLLFLITFILICLPTLLFFSIYTKPHSRITATNWIDKNIPSGSIILSEHWDDALPLYSAEQTSYAIYQLPVFDPDTKDKWDKINALLNQGNYLILSSNRGWGSIPTVSEKYPLMTNFYRNLFNNKLPYKKLKEFTSYPSLTYLGIPITIPDDWAEEAFTVYDHPKVYIFKNTLK